MAAVDVAESPETASTRGWLIAAYLLGALVLLLGVEIGVIGRFRLEVFNNYDLGIYSRALYLISWDDLNPWLTNRETKIFNDHFDPVLLLAAPWAKLAEPAAAAMIFEALVVLASGVPIVWLYRRGAASATVAATAILYLLLNRATISAVEFPVHPTTWAMLPMTWLGGALILDRKWHVFLAFTLLCCCKEEFPFVGVMLALYYVSLREWRFGAFLGSWSALWLLGTLVLRPWLLGEVQHHASHRFVDLGNPLAGLATAFEQIDWQRLVHLWAPLLPLAVWAICKQRSIAWRLLLLPLPLVMIRFLAGAWLAHYMAPIIPLWLLGVMPRGADARFPRTLLAATAALLLVMAWGPLQRSAQVWTEPAAIAWAPRDPERLAAIARGREFLLQHADGKALVQSNLIPRLVRRPEIYQMAGPHDPSAHEFRYVFVERPPHGDAWPIAHDGYAKMLAAWRAAPETRVILDDGHVFLAEGSFRDVRR